MSAYIVDREHIAYLVEAAMSPQLSPFQNGPGFYYYHDGKARHVRYRENDEAARIGQMLWDENFASVTHRYPDDSFDTLPGPVGENFVYGRHEPLPVEIDPVQVLKAAHCYQYQSCEHPGWEQSEARTFIKALIHRAISALPGYEEAEWGPPNDCYAKARS